MEKNDSDLLLLAVEDGLPPAHRAGEVITYPLYELLLRGELNMEGVMSYDEFKSLPQKEKAETLRGLLKICQGNRRILAKYWDVPMPRIHGWVSRLKLADSAGGQESPACPEEKDLFTLTVAGVYTAEEIGSRLWSIATMLSELKKEETYKIELTVRKEPQV